MQSRPLASLKRILMVAGAIGFGASGLLAQAPAKPAPSDIPIPKVDIFLGYSYFSPKGNGVDVTYPDGTLHNYRYSSVDQGAIASGTFYFNKYVGAQAEFAAHPDGNNDSFYTLQGGLVLRYPLEDGLTPWAHGLAGGADVGGPNSPPPYGTYHNTTWGPALTVGGGFDYDTPLFNHHLGIRLFQADFEYIHANFGPQDISGGRANINAARVSTGLLFRFGNITPPPPVTYSCSASPATVYQGDPVTVTGTATYLNPKKTATYSWSGQGVTVKGDSTTGTVDTSSLQPGTYTITGHVSESTKPGRFADCTTTFTVQPFGAPTVSCLANPSSVKPGDSSTITSQGVSPQNRPLTYSFSTSAGQISGSGNTATLSTGGAPSGSITVTCNVADDKGQTASATTSVDVAAPPVPVIPHTQKLCSINFDHDAKRPTRVDNEAKACLDDVTLNAQRSSDATLVVVGSSAPDETAKPGKHHEAPVDLAAQRAVNTKDYLVKEKGIDASRISVRTGTAGAKEVDNYLVPAGATFDSDVSGTTAVDEGAVKVQPRKALAEKKHHHKK